MIRVRQVESSVLLIRSWNRAVQVLVKGLWKKLHHLINVIVQRDVDAIALLHHGFARERYR